MAFFDERPHYIPPDAAAQRQFDDWYSNDRYHAGLGRRPRLEVPAVVALTSRVLVHTAEIALAITHVEAYRSGIGFPLMLRTKVGLDGSHQLGEQILRPRAAQDYTAGPSEPLPAHAFRFGVQLADGSTATNLDILTPAEERVGTSLAFDGGRGYGVSAWDLDVWVRPLPPPGPLTFVCEWPAHGIAETRLEIDAHPISNAGGRSIVF